jgi:glycosyltransferase 2 family protein
LTEPAQSAPPALPSTEGGKRRWARWPNIAGWVVSAAALAYVLSRVHLSELSRGLHGITWWMMIAAIVVEIIPRVLEAVRWRSLLQPVCTRFSELLQAIYIGTVYSAILPLSGGDVVRGVIVARKTGASLTQVLSTELVERVVDAAAIVLVVWFALRGLVLPRALQVVRIVIEVGVGVAIAAGLLLALRRASLLSRFEGWKVSNRVLRRIRLVGLDLVQALGWTRLTAIGVTFSAALGAAAVNVTAYWLILHAYHILLSPIQAAGLFAIVMIGTFMPGTPGNVGSWQFFCTIGLQLFGVGATRAAGFSIVAYFIWTVPPLLMGLGALAFSPFRWSELESGPREPSMVVPGVCDVLVPGKKRDKGGDVR